MASTAIRESSDLSSLQTTSAYSGRLSVSALDCTNTLRALVPSGVFSCQARVPISASPYFRLQWVFSFFLTHEGEVVDAVTPAGLPQEPSPLEEDKLVYATTTTASSGPLRWIPPGAVVACKVSVSFPELLVYLHWVLSMYFHYATTTSTSSGARRVDARRR